MRLSHPDECDWSPEDRVTFRKWCRIVLVFYGCVFLALLAALVATPVANVGTNDVASTVDLLGTESQPHSEESTCQRS
jgi:hypothetical protein